MNSRRLPRFVTHKQFNLLIIGGVANKLKLLIPPDIISIIIGMIDTSILYNYFKFQLIVTEYIYDAYNYIDKEPLLLSKCHYPQLQKLLDIKWIHTILIPHVIQMLSNASNLLRISYKKFGIPLIFLAEIFFKLIGLPSKNFNISALSDCLQCFSDDIDNYSINYDMTQNDIHFYPRIKCKFDLLYDYLIYIDKIETEFWSFSPFISFSGLKKKIKKQDQSYQIQIIDQYQVSSIEINVSLNDVIFSLKKKSSDDLFAIWYRIKNEDGIIVTKQSLFLCLHVLIRMTIEEYAYVMELNTDVFTRLGRNSKYLQFIENIGSVLCEHFVDRNVRNNISTSEITFVFEDFVDRLPQWLQLTNDILLSSLLSPIECYVR